MRLVSHEQFESTEAAIRKESDILSDTLDVEIFPVRKRVADTDNGSKIKEMIGDLEKLLGAYRDGVIPERV